MNHKIPTPVRVIVGLIILAIIGFYIFTTFLSSVEGPLTASGTVEAIDVQISSELPGKVSSVAAAEGQVVKAGDELFTIDGTLLEAQRAVAQANYDSALTGQQSAALAVEQAQARYDAAYDKAQVDARVLRTSELLQGDTDLIDQPEWYFTIDETLSSLLVEETNALEGLAQAKEDLISVSERAGSSDFLTLEKDLNDAKVKYEVARDLFNKLNSSGGSADLVDEAQINMDDAKLDLDAAEREYNDALTTDGAVDVIDARVKLHLAQQRVDTVQLKIMRFQTGDASTELKMAEIALRQAQAQLDTAESAVNTSAANLALSDAQLAKLSVVSPVDAIVQTKNIEVGEMENAGMVAFSLVKLEDLTLTVYVTEDHYGEVSLNQSVEIRVDSFPDQVFSGIVTRISDQAEFTPRNVQTVDGRKTTVFAIKIRVQDPEGSIKPGMPADVTFIK